MLVKNIAIEAELYFDGESCVINIPYPEVVVYPDGRIGYDNKAGEAFMIADTEEELQKELDRFLEAILSGDSDALRKKVVIVDDIAWENVSA